MRLLIETLKNPSSSSSSYRAECLFTWWKLLGPWPHQKNSASNYIGLSPLTKAEVEGRLHRAWNNLQASVLLCSACGFAFCQLHCRTQHFLSQRRKSTPKKALECKGDFTEVSWGEWGNKKRGFMPHIMKQTTQVNISLQIFIFSLICLLLHSHQVPSFFSRTYRPNSEQVYKITLLMNSNCLEGICC